MLSISLLVLSLTLFCCDQVNCDKTSRYLAAFIGSNATSEQQSSLDIIDGHLKESLQRLFSVEISITNAANYSDIEAILDRSLFTAFPQADSLTLIIEGNFSKELVRVTHQLTIAYEELVNTWFGLL